MRRVACTSADSSGGAVRGFLVPLDRAVGRLAHTAARMRSVLAEAPRRALWPPLAAPIATAPCLAYLAGRLLTRLAPAAIETLLLGRGGERLTL